MSACLSVCFRPYLNIRIAPPTENHLNYLKYISSCVPMMPISELLTNANETVSDAVIDRQRQQMGLFNKLANSIILNEVRMCCTELITGLTAPHKVIDRIIFFHLTAPCLLSLHNRRKDRFYKNLTRCHFLASLPPVRERWMEEWGRPEM